MKTCPVPLRLIVTIVNRGYADSVIEAARKAGAEGATVVTGRGIGIHEQARILGIPIEPEKEIVLILIRDELAEGVLEAIGRGVDLEKPGRGLAFVVDVSKVVGMPHASDRAEGGAVRQSML